MQIRQMLPLGLYQILSVDQCFPSIVAQTQEFRTTSSSYSREIGSKVNKILKIPQKFKTYLEITRECLSLCNQLLLRFHLAFISCGSLEYEKKNWMGSSIEKGFWNTFIDQKHKVNVVPDSFTWRRLSFGSGGWSRAKRDNSWLRISWMRVD